MMFVLCVCLCVWLVYSISKQQLLNLKWKKEFIKIREIKKNERDEFYYISKRQKVLSLLFLRFNSSFAEKTQPNPRRLSFLTKSPFSLFPRKKTKKRCTIFKLRRKSKNNFVHKIMKISNCRRHNSSFFIKETLSTTTICFVSTATKNCSCIFLKFRALFKPKILMFSLSDSPPLSLRSNKIRFVLLLWCWRKIPTQQCQQLFNFILLYWFWLKKKKVPWTREEKEAKREKKKNLTQN